MCLRLCTFACLLRSVSLYVCLSTLESSAGVGDGDDGGAQSEQGSQEMGNEGGQRTQEHYTLQESKME